MQHPGGLVADPGVSGGDLAGPGLDVHGVPEVYVVELGVQVLAPSLGGPLVHDATGCPPRASLGRHFLQL